MRRQPLAIRKPCGRVAAPKDPKLLSPSEARRLLDAAAAGLRDPVWGTAIGRLYINGQLSSAQFAAAKRWAELVANYSIAVARPRHLEHYRLL